MGEKFHLLGGGMMQGVSNKCKRCKREPYFRDGNACFDHKCTVTNCGELTIDNFDYCHGHKCDEPKCNGKNLNHYYLCQRQTSEIKVSWCGLGKPKKITKMIWNKDKPHKCGEHACGYLWYNVTFDYMGMSEKPYSVNTSTFVCHKKTLPGMKTCNSHICKVLQCQNHILSRPNYNKTDYDSTINYYYCEKHQTTSN